MSIYAGKLYHPVNGYGVDIWDGFSFPCLFAGFFWYAYKNMWAWAAIGLLLAIFTLGLSWLVFPFIANSQHKKYLLVNGYVSVEHLDAKAGKSKVSSGSVIYEGERNIKLPKYQIYLTNKYIEKNQVLDRFIIGEELFEKLSDALDHADKVELSEQNKFEANNNSINSSKQNLAAPAYHEKSKRIAKYSIAALAITILALLIIGVYAFISISSPIEPNSLQLQEDANDQPPILVKLDPFFVPLSDQKSSLSVLILFLLANANVEEKINSKLPEVREVLANLMSNKSVDELSNQMDKDDLALEIQDRVNSIIGITDNSQGVKKVLFGAFLIQ